MLISKNELCNSCRQIYSSDTGMTVERMLDVFNNDAQKLAQLGGEYSLHCALYKVLIDGGHCTRCVGLVLDRMRGR